MVPVVMMSPHCGSGASDATVRRLESVFVVSLLAHVAVHAQHRRFVHVRHLVGDDPGQQRQVSMPLLKEPELPSPCADAHGDVVENHPNRRSSFRPRRGRSSALMIVAARARNRLFVELLPVDDHVVQPMIASTRSTMPLSAGSEPSTAAARCSWSAKVAAVELLRRSAPRAWRRISRRSPVSPTSHPLEVLRVEDISSMTVPSSRFGPADASAVEVISFMSAFVAFRFVQRPALRRRPC